MSNSNARGNTHDRRRRREWMIANFIDADGKIPCHWCPRKLDVSEFEIDRYPVCGHDGGTYRRENIVPACTSCNGGRCGNQHRGCRGDATKYYVAKYYATIDQTSVAVVEEEVPF